MSILYLFVQTKTNKKQFGNPEECQEEAVQVKDKKKKTLCSMVSWPLSLPSILQDSITQQHEPTD